MIDETQARKRLRDACIAMQNAQGALFDVRNMTNDVRLERVCREIDGTLSLLRDVGNQEINRLDDYLDGGA